MSEIYSRLKGTLQSFFLIGANSGLHKDVLLRDLRRFWVPPSDIYATTLSFTVGAGIYYKAGMLYDGAYVGNFKDYWEVSADYTVTITDSFVANTTSGIPGGYVPRDHWMAVYQLGSSSAGGTLLLPFIQPYSSTYTSGETRLAVSKHIGTATAATGSFVNAADVYNGYMLKIIGVTDTYRGDTFTILDTVSTTNDYISVTGDETTKIPAGTWLQMYPASGDYVYIGAIRMSSSGTITPYLRRGRRTLWNAGEQVSTLYKHATNFSFSRLGEGVSPLARRCRSTLYVSSEASACTGVGITLAYDSSGSNLSVAATLTSASTSYLRKTETTDFDLLHTLGIYCNAYQYAGSNAAANLAEAWTYWYDEAYE